jgi:hypothetical protein
MTSPSRALAVLALVLATPASALTVSLNPGVDDSRLLAEIYDPTLGFALPQVETPLGAVPSTGSGGWLPGSYPPYEAWADYALGHDGLSFDVTTVREGELESIAAVRGEVRFAVDEAVGYALSATYVLSDPTGYTAELWVHLRDETDAVSLYFTDRVVQETPNPAIDVADPHVFDVGSLTGALVPGHEYFLDFRFVSYALDFPPPEGIPGAGSGALTLSFVPEPGLALLALVAAASLARAPRRG